MNKWFNIRCYMICFCLVAGFSMLSWRLINLQMVEREEIREKTGLNNIRTTYLPASRGHLLDCNEELIARSIPTGKLVIDKKQLREKDVALRTLAYHECSNDPTWETKSATAKKNAIRSAMKQMKKTPSDILIKDYESFVIDHMAPILEKKREEISERLNKNENEQEFVLAKNLTEKQCDALMDFKKENRIDGYEVEKTSRRWYASPGTAAHIVGYTTMKEVSFNNRSFDKEVGAFGAEASLEQLLAGQDGFRTSKRNNNGELITIEPVKTKPPRAGLNVQLTIDMEVQAMVEEELERTLKQNQAKKGAVIILNPKNGAIMAIASYPKFDLNEKNDLETNSNNYAIQAVYEPGSTIKTLGAAAAMNEDLVTINSPINCDPAQLMKVGRNDHHNYGTLTVEGVLKKSSNSGAYNIACKLGINRYYDYLDKFGLGQKTKINLSHEAKGYFPHDDNLTDFAGRSYGYALNVTPMQMVCAYAVVAGNGELLEPQIVKSVIANDGTVIQQSKRVVVRRVISESVAKKLRHGLIAVTQEGGTATAACVPGFKVAGKTGTANKFDEARKKYFENRYFCSFAGMMPADDPAFVGIVVIDDPQTNEEARLGGMVAAPAFSRIASRLATHLHLTPTEAAPLSASTR